jgi:ABC-2 type transport system permease protein
VKKILLIIKREYLTKIRKKSFILMTVLSPIFFSLIAIIPAAIAIFSNDDFKKIAVIDETRIFNEALTNSKYLQFDFISAQYYDKNTSKYDVSQAKLDIKESEYFALLYIPHTIIQGNKGAVELFSYEQINLDLEMNISNSIEKKIENIKLDLKAEEFGLSHEDIENILKTTSSNINVKSTIIDKKGQEKESSATIAMIVAYILGFMIYTFVFMYGSQVMRSVLEEKTNRIVEVLVSSIKPMQLMLGKIIGVALVGLTQFAIWVVLTITFVEIGSSFLKTSPEFQLNQQIANNSPISAIDTLTNNEHLETLPNIINSIVNINYVLIISLFIIYFIGGYLLYASLFAAVGSAVDRETDSQQFMLPISIPLFIGIILLTNITKNPNGPIALWSSMIPFTSPIVMMARIPYGVPFYQIIVSLVILIGSFIFTTWISAKIYRVGILMYGKKITYKELWKWIKYKN